MACTDCSFRCSANATLSGFCPADFFSDSMDYCVANCGCLDCKDQNRTYCDSFCRGGSPIRPNTTCGRDVQSISRLCAGQIRDNNNCTEVVNDLIQDTNCTVQPEKCEEICSDALSPMCAVDIVDFCFSIPELAENVLVSSVEDIIEAAIFNALLDETVGDLEDLVDGLENNFDLLANDRNVERLSEVIEELFSDENMDKWENTSVNQPTEARALRIIESMTELVSESFNGSRNTSFEFERENFFMTVSATDRSEAVDNRQMININDTEVQVPIDILCDESETEKCSSIVAVSLVNNLAEYLHRTQQNNKFTDYNPSSRLLSVQIFGIKDLVEQLKEKPVEIITPLVMNSNLSEGDLNSTCVFWNVTSNAWSNAGVRTEVNQSDNTVKCVSTHLTSFAVLVSFNPRPNNTNVSEQIALSVVSYIGCCISIVCLLATIVCLIAFRKIMNKGPLMYVHLNLAIALLLGYTVFVVGVQTAVPIEALCIIVAALMQYFFLASFCWMLSEGIMLYLLVVRVFGSAAQKWYWLLILGWGLPLPIVVISAAVLTERYRTDEYCWIDANPSGAALWTFVVPMLLIILINTIILILTVGSIVRGKKYGGAETEVSNKTLVVATIRGTLILLPLLGITWVIGLFAVNENTTVFAWLFVIMNTLQGMFIFLLHVVRNDALLRKIKLVCCKRRMEKTSDYSAVSAKSKTLDTTVDSGPLSPTKLDSPFNKKEECELEVWLDNSTELKHQNGVETTTDDSTDHENKTADNA